MRAFCFSRMLTLIERTRRSGEVRPVQAGASRWAASARIAGEAAPCWAVVAIGRNDPRRRRYRTAIGCSARAVRDV